MERAKRSLLHRGVIGALVASLFLTSIYLTWDYIPVFILAVFLYYAVRPLHNTLRVLHIPRRIRAALSILLFGLPFVVLTTYSLSLIVLEAQVLLDAYHSQENLLADLLVSTDLNFFDQQELHQRILEIQQQVNLTDGLASLTDVVSMLSTAFIQLTVLLVLTYSMLVDGPRLKNWVVRHLDHGDVLAKYTEMADKELSATLFGNIVNVFTTGVVAVLVFVTYNMLVPAAIHVPYPSLLGALTGVGSLIPVVGIKLVYIPLISWLAGTAWILDEPNLFGPIAILFIVSAVIIDFIPDMFIRAFVSGDETHTGVLVVAYIIGPTVLGIYGLFLAPILLVLLICAGHVLVPYVVHGEMPSDRQVTFEAYESADSSQESSQPRWQVVVDRVVALVNVGVERVNRLR